jgi:hypothetical protein
MSPLKPLTDALQALPSAVRKTIYSLLALAGVALAICNMTGVEDLGPLTLSQALQVYAYLSPVMGAVAVANVGQRAPKAPESAELSDFEEDVDLSSFEPVGLVSDVYGEALA